MKNKISPKLAYCFFLNFLILIFCFTFTQTSLYSGGESKAQVSSGENSTLFDFDGDGKADISVYRRSEAIWYRLNSSDNSFTAIKFGMPDRDLIAPADFDGDGVTDIAVYRSSFPGPIESFIHIIESSTNTYKVNPLGNVLGSPFPGDWDGDGKADPTVFDIPLRIPEDPTPPFCIFTLFESGDLGAGPKRRTVFPGGNAVFGDFSGDGKSNFASFYKPRGSENAIWVIRPSSPGSIREISFGFKTDIPVPADYNGDGVTDLAVYRDGNWYILTDLNSTNYYVVQFGLPDDKPVPADYDGDGKADVAVYRDGTWYILQSTEGFKAIQFGLPDDKPIPHAYIY